MKRAWSIYNSGHSFYSLSFSTSLERSWVIESEDIKYENKQEELKAHIEWYNNNEELISKIADKMATRILQGN